MGPRPVVAPVHRRAVGREEAHADRKPFDGFVVEVDVQRGGEFVVRLLDGPRRVVVVQVGQRTIAHVGGDARGADRDIELRLLERCGRRVEEDRLRVELHGRTHVSHGGLSGRHVVDLVAFGQGGSGDGDGCRQKENSFHTLSFGSYLHARRRAGIGAKVCK